MTNESNCPAKDESESASDLKASDFFPPGTGWNRAPADDRKQAREELDGQAARGEIGQH